MQTLMAAGGCSLGIGPSHVTVMSNLKKLFSDNHQIILNNNIKNSRI